MRGLRNYILFAALFSLTYCAKPQSPRRLGDSYWAVAERGSGSFMCHFGNSANFACAWGVETSPNSMNLMGVRGHYTTSGDSVRLNVESTTCPSNVSALADTLKDLRFSEGSLQLTSKDSIVNLKQIQFGALPGAIGTTGCLHRDGTFEPHGWDVDHR